MANNCVILVSSKCRHTYLNIKVGIVKNLNYNRAIGRIFSGFKAGDEWVMNINYQITWTKIPVQIKKKTIFVSSHLGGQFFHVGQFRLKSLYNIYIYIYMHTYIYILICSTGSRWWGAVVVPVASISKSFWLKKF